MSWVKILFVTLMFFILPLAIFAENQEDFEKLRVAQIEQWGGSGVPQPTEILLRAKLVLSKPLAKQTLAELKKTAKQTNIAANYVGFILEEYASYYRENYKYDFVQKSVVPFHDELVRLTNELKNCRNLSFLNIGKKLAASGREIEAFFYFRDAFRLSTFTEEDGDHKGMRFKAEQEMKKLMGLSGIDSFIYWKTDY